MNHIIHAATHPSWRLEPYADDEEMFREMEAYLDLIVSQVKCVAGFALRMHLQLVMKMLIAAEICCSAHSCNSVTS